MLTYVRETWVISMRQKSRIQVAEIKVVSQTRDSVKKVILKNEQIRQDLGVKPILEYINRGNNFGGVVYTELAALDK